MKKDLSYRGIVVADFWVSDLWSLHGALSAKTETHKTMAFSAFGRNSCSPLQQRCVGVQTCFPPDSKNAILGLCLPVFSWGEATSIPAFQHSWWWAEIQWVLQPKRTWLQWAMWKKWNCVRYKFIPVVQEVENDCLFYFPWYLGGGTQNKNAELGFPVFTAGSFDSPWQYKLWFGGGGWGLQIHEVLAAPNEELLAEPSCGLCVTPVSLCSGRTDL